MSKTLYLECNSGISGDMTVAALIDLGVDTDVLMRALKSIPTGGFEIKISRVKKAGLDMCDFDVVLDKEHENHDHDMEYLHGKEEHIHHEDKHNHHHHEHTNLSQIIHIINHIDATENAKNIAKKIFEIIAKAEAKAHGVSMDEVHFHEVGAIDSIVDIVAAAVCFDNLNIDKCIIPYVNEGTGTVRCQHGLLPVPVPAVVNIIADNDISLTITDTKGELVTPTGAAIVAAVRTSDILPKKFSIEKIGMGAGKRTYDRPSILRAMIISEHDFQTKDTKKDYIYKLETNIDDCSGEALGFVMEQLFEAGAKDVNFEPVYMKKNRPAYQLNVICSLEDVDIMEKIIFKGTTTIGIRRQRMERTILKRRNEIVETLYGQADVKVCEIDGSVIRYPEYESVASMCRKTGKSYKEIYELIERIADNGQ